MINRLRYSLHVERTVDERELRGRFPVASRMAEVARDVIADETGLMMDSAEVALAATYFQVFLEDHVARQNRPFNVAVLTGHGPGTARLIRAQLAKLLPQDTTYPWSPPANLEPPHLEGVDLVVTTPGSQLRLDVPTIELSEVFDRGELIREAERHEVRSSRPAGPERRVGFDAGLAPRRRAVPAAADGQHLRELACPYFSTGCRASAW